MHNFFWDTRENQKINQTRRPNFVKFVSWQTKIEGSQKAPFFIATTPKCGEGH